MFRMSRLARVWITEESTRVCISCLFHFRVYEGMEGLFRLHTLINILLLCWWTSHSMPHFLKNAKKHPQPSWDKDKSSLSPSIILAMFIFSFRRMISSICSSCRSCFLLFPAFLRFPAKTHLPTVIPPNTKNILQNWSATPISNNLQKSKISQTETQPRWVWVCGWTQTLLINNNIWLLTPFWKAIIKIFMASLSFLF